MMNSRPSFIRPLAFVVASTVSIAGCAADTSTDDSAAGSTDSDLVRSQSISSLALANVGKGACSTNSKGGRDFDSSCDGNGGLPEYWCADFARWVWAQAGASNAGELTAAAGSFYTYGQRHGTLHDTPAVGDAVVFNYNGSGYADHVAIVTAVNANGTIESVSGDWQGDNGSEAHFASTAHVVRNAPAYSHAVGSVPAIIGMKISGFISPVGLTTVLGPPTTVLPAPKGCGVIRAGQGLKAGESVRSCDGAHTLSMQTDGNFVLYHGASAVWSSGTDGTDGYVAAMQTDGNLVVYGKRTNALWSSHTFGHASDHLAIQNDGNVVVYSTNGHALWETATNGH